MPDPQYSVYVDSQLYLRALVIRRLACPTVRLLPTVETAYAEPHAVHSAVSAFFFLLRLDEEASRGEPRTKPCCSANKTLDIFFFETPKLSLTALGGGGVARRAAAAFARAVASISAISAISAVSAISSFSRSRSAAAR